MIDAARALLAEGTTPTVEGAAARAGVSRATAYRYFTNQRELLVATHPMLDMASLLPSDPPDDPVERVQIVANRILELTLGAEAELRMSLRLSLEPGTGQDLPLRKGRRLIWFEDALQPLRGHFKPGPIRRRSVALAASIGIETLVWLTDIAGLSREQAVRQLLWTARSLTQGALATR
jgi:AcrR family transcriptional regulator